MAANQVTQSTKLQVSAAVIEAARINLQQYTLHVTTAFYCSMFQCIFHHAAQASFTSMVPAMQQQGASQAARKQLMWGHHLAAAAANTAAGPLRRSRNFCTKAGLLETQSNGQRTASLAGQLCRVCC